MAPFSPFPRARPRGKNCGGTAKKQVVKKLPLYSPLDSARHAPGGAWVQTIVLYAGRMVSMQSLVQLEKVGARSSRAAPGRSGPLLR